MSNGFEDIKCSACGRIGCNEIDESPCKGHPNVTETFLVCRCGQDLFEVDLEGNRV